MASNLIENKKAALKRCNTRSVTGWTDSRDQNRFGGDLMLYINENIPCRPLNQHSKIADLKLIVFELHQSKRKWFFLGICKPPCQNDMSF